jgi:hypothetical protein
MVSRTSLDHLPAPIVPINDETHAMLEYAESAETQSKFDEARHEIEDGKGIAPNAEYFTELNRRISERARNVGPNDEA